MSSLPPLAVLAAAPKSGLPRPRADYFDLTFNQAVDPNTFSTADVTLTTPGGTMPASQLTLQNLGGTRWRIGFPRQSALGSYQYTVGPALANLTGVPMAAAYSGGFTVNPNTWSNRVSVATQGTGLRMTLPSLAGLDYQLLRSTDLVNWENLGPVLSGDDLELGWSVSTTDAQPAFFRLQITDSP